MREIESARAPFVTGTGDPGKPRHASAAYARRFPLTVLNAWLAKPFSRAAVTLRLSPDQVTVVSLVVSLAGVVLVATGDYGRAALGAGLVFLGLLLDHADGQVARRTGRSSVWGMYLDSVFDRVVEAGLLLAVLVAGLRGDAGWDRFGWALLPLGGPALATLAALTLAAVFLAKYVTTYGTLLYLRQHILAGGGRLDFARGPPPAGWRQWIPGYNRDVFLVAWCLGIALGQVPVVLLALTGMGLLQAAVGMRNFRRGHPQSSQKARAAFDPDFH
jgi:hypothetical protein